jgi:hypothetical protein
VEVLGIENVGKFRMPYGHLAYIFYGLIYNLK